uniref:Uncharacterized protein n=1 Tax=Molossus molossus TaxID=27622 RepID=A0A7J8EEE0_MOLMO|nr:hypothetical protein HJG59_008886 [Molossus molossus]
MLGTQSLPEDHCSTVLSTQSLPEDHCSTVLGTQSLPEDHCSTALGTQSLPEDHCSTMLGTQSLPEDHCSTVLGTQSLPEDHCSTVLGTQSLPEDHYSTVLGVSRWKCGTLTPMQRSTEAAQQTAELAKFNLSFLPSCLQGKGFDKFRRILSHPEGLLYQGERSQVKATTQHALGPLCQAPFLS